MKHVTRSLIRGAALAAALAVPMTSSFAQAPSADSNSTPGWTGRTEVVGSHSSIAGDLGATRMFQTGQY